MGDLTGEERQVSATDVPAEEDMMIDVRVYRDGDLVHRQECGSMEEAWLVVDEWTEMGGVSFEVGDLLVQQVGSFAPGGSNP
jgi:hypothetical protein